MMACRILSVAAFAMGLGTVSCGANAADMKVTLLGTGTPTPRISAFSASTLIEAGPEKILIDLGRGSTIRLYQKRIPLGTITAHFITHPHSDHRIGLPDMWLTGWLAIPSSSRKTPIVIFGPAVTTAMTEYLTKAFSEDIRIRLDDEHLPPAGIQFAATEFVQASHMNETASECRPSRSTTARRFVRLWVCGRV
jgi:ribonuclease BN (tRNA processing enzyme)